MPNPPPPWHGALHEIQSESTRRPSRERWTTTGRPLDVSPAYLRPGALRASQRRVPLRQVVTFAPFASAMSSVAE